MPAMKEIGHLLRETRDNLGYDVDKVAKELKVRGCYIQALESGDVSDISKDIYIIGYLKSYASWLGLNSDELVAKFKAENEDFSVANKITTEASSFFNTEDELLSPAKPLVLVSILLVLITYIIWKKEIAIYNNVAIGLQTQSWINDSKYKGFAYNAARHKPVMLLAQDDAEVQLYYSDYEIVKKNLASGEMFFLENNRNVIISSDNPEKIDIISDDQEGRFIGVLEDFYVLN